MNFENELNGSLASLCDSTITPRHLKGNHNNLQEEDAAFGEAGGEEGVTELKARDPSFFEIPWDPPDLDAIRDDRPTMLTVVTNEQLTDVQRVYIRTDATVRSNRVWKGRYDRYNGQYFIDALKEASVYPQPEIEPKKKKKDILATMGEGEGEENVVPEGEGEEEVGEDVGEGEGEETEERDPISMILNALKFVQEKHDELWQLEELDKLCNEYQRKAREIQETKRDWKMRIVKIQMGWAKQMTEELAERQKHLVKIKEDLEDFELRKALKRYEQKKYLKLLTRYEKAMEEKRKLLEKRAQEQEAEEAHEELSEEQTVEERQLKKLEAMKRSLMMSLKGKKKEKEDAKPKDEEPLEESLEEEQSKIEDQEDEGEDQIEAIEIKSRNFGESTEEEKPEATALKINENLPQVKYTENGLEIPIQVRHFSLKLKPENALEKKYLQKEKKDYQNDVIPIKEYVDDKGILIKEIPLYIAVPDDYPNKRMIQENLEQAVELSHQVPDTNPYELALCKTVGQDVFHQLQIRYNKANRTARLNLPNCGPKLKQILPWGKYGSSLQSKMNWVKCLYDTAPRLYKIQPPSSGVSLGFADTMRFLGTNLRPRPKFAKVGTLRYIAGRTEFVPELRNFDQKTREILKRNKKEELLKLPVTTFEVADSVATFFMEPPGPSEADEHVTFRGVIKRLEGKSLMRIFVEETLSSEEYRRRYKGRKWMERKLSELYKDFTEKKNEVMEKGIVGRQATERREGLELTCCPIFWGIANYLRSLLENSDGKPISIKNIPKTFEELKILFQHVILEMRPELKQRSQELDALLTKWGGYEMCKIDLVSIANLMWILSEIEEVKPYWVEIRERLVDSSTCPLCLLFDFLKGDKKVNVMRFVGEHRKNTDKLNMPKELMDIENIAHEFKTREKAAVDPALFPDNNLFHIITTENEHRNSKTFSLGQHRDATRLFVMRSCGTVIFDISRSEKEIPWIWSYLKQHMELLDKKDVRDEADVEPMRHLILITNFLSWAKSPKQVRMNLSEKTFQQRVPHPDYVGNLKLENTIYYIGVNYKQFKLRTTIIFTGIPFGEEEDVLVYLFKMAWDNELELPLFGKGRNVLPLIHIMDLKWIIVRTVNERTYPPMIFALNKNDQSLFAMASRIAKTFGSTKVVKFPSPDFKMKFCIPKIIDDLLKQNIRYDYVETPYQVRPIWNHAFMKQKKIQEVIRELRESRKLYGKSVFLIGPPSKAKSELAIILSKLYNLPLIHKGNILNYFLRATQEPEPSKGEGEEEEETGEEEEEEEPEKEEEEEGEEKKIKKSADPMGEEKKYLKIMKKMTDGKPANRERKHLTKLLQKLLQSVFIQSHGYVLVDWPIRKEDTIALFTKTLDDPQAEEEMEAEPKPPPPRPDYVIEVAASDQYLDETNYFLFQDLCLKSFDEMESDLREYRYYRQIHQSVVDLFEERNNPIYRLTAHDGFKVVGKLIAILGEPQQASGRWIYDMFLKTELACSDDAIKKGERKIREAKWLKRRYKHSINELLTARRERHFSLREQLHGIPLNIFKNNERISSNPRFTLYDDYKEWREMMGMMKLKKKWTEPSRVWRHVENRRWIASFEKAKEYWMK